MFSPRLFFLCRCKFFANFLKNSCIIQKRVLSLQQQIKTTHTMKMNELPLDIQAQLAKERLTLAGKNCDTPYEVLRYNKEGTRYFIARRVCHSWNDDRGNSMPFGGGTHWTIKYGAVQFRAVRNCMGQREYELANGVTYGKSANGTQIPPKVGTKKEVIKVLSAIGIF